MNGLIDRFINVWHIGNAMDRACFILLAAVIVLNILRIALLVYDTFFRGTADAEDVEG